MSTKILWTDETWQPVVGCSKVSPGCDNCYAERMAFRVHNMAWARGQTKLFNKYDPIITGKGKWTGKTTCDESTLDKPLHWKKPRRIFVCSMGDLFHESVPFEFIDKVMAVIALCPQHTFQVLTKRPERMAEYFNSRKPDVNGGNILVEQKHLCKLNLGGKPVVFPYRNLWLGVTAENQEQADKRIPILLQIPAAVRFVSIEPMLGAVDLKEALWGCPTVLQGKCDPDTADSCNACPDCTEKPNLDWVIVGGESGPGARWCPLGNTRSVVGQCQDAGVPVLVKQIHIWDSTKNKHRLVKDISQFPEDLRIREYPKQRT